MTPQLMQAIKLLQLSNLDLVAYVEAELERNPLLDRGAETEPATGAADGAQADKPAVNGEAPNGEDIAADIEARPRQGRTARRYLSGRRRIDPAADVGYAGGLFGMGRHRLRRPRRRRLQSRSLRVRRNHAGGLAARAIDVRHHRSGAAHDRSIPDRSRRRDRLSERRARRGGGKARHQRRRGRSRPRHPANFRSARHLRARPRRMPGAPAQGARPLRSRDAGADHAARPSGQARFRRSSRKSAASATRILPT